MKHTRPVFSTLNGMALLVDAFSKIQEKYDTPGHYRIQFALCSCKVVDRNERKKLMNNYRQNQDYKAMEPANFYKI